MYYDWLFFSYYTFFIFKFQLFLNWIQALTLIFIYIISEFILIFSLNFNYSLVVFYMESYFNITYLSFRIELISEFIVLFILNFNYYLFKYSKLLIFIPKIA